MKKRWPSFLIKKWHDICSWKTILVCLVLLHYTFHCMTEIWFFTERNAICQFFWGPIHCDNSHAMPVKASDCFASITRNMVTLQSPLNTLCDLAFQLVGLHTSNCLLDIRIFYLIYVITIEKWDFSIMILNFNWTGWTRFTSLFLWEVHLFIIIP